MLQHRPKEQCAGIPRAQQPRREEPEASNGHGFGAAFFIPCHVCEGGRRAGQRFALGATVLYAAQPLGAFRIKDDIAEMDMF